MSRIVMTGWRIVFLDGSAEVWPSVHFASGWVMCFPALGAPAEKWVPAERIKEVIPGVPCRPNEVRSEEPLGFETRVTIARVLGAEAQRLHELKRPWEASQLETIVQAAKDGTLLPGGR